jgi:nickel transport protein
MRVLLMFLMVFMFGSVHAHEVHAHVADGQVKIVTLQYADGEPFSYEAYVIHADENAPPVQKGRTDAQGRIAVLPIPGKKLTLKATSEDGHGAVMVFDPTENSGTSSGDKALPRALLLLCGLSLVFGVFGLWVLFMRNRKKKESCSDSAEAIKP